MKLDGLDRVIGLASQLEMTYRTGNGLARIGYELSQLKLLLEEDNDSYATAFYQRAHPFWPGERSDINDVAGSLTSISLWWLGVASTRSIVVPHPGVYIPSEIYALYLIPEQPNGAISRASKYDEDSLLSLLFGMAESEMMTSAIWSAMDDGPGAREYAYDKPEMRPWGQQAAQLLFGADLRADDILVWRRSPDWCYYRSAFDGTSVVKSAKLAFLVRIHLDTAQAILKDESSIELFEKQSGSPSAINEYRPRIRKDSLVPGITGSLYVRNRLNNFVSYRAVNRARRVLEGLEGKGDHIIIPTEDIFCVVGRENLLFLPHSGGCGLRTFSKEKQKLWERHRAEAELFAPEAYEWIEPTDPTRFESLIYDLISREPGVLNVRMAGDTRDRDGGRDLIVDWRRPSIPGSIGSDERLPMQVRSFIVQCKARGRNIGSRDVPEIIDSLYHYHADGYLLAVSRQVTSSLVDRLDDMRRRRDFDTDWWTRKEIEDRLKCNPDISSNYSDLFRKKNSPEPDS